MSKVIIVSNRLPVSVKKVDGALTFSPSVGGLATGLSSYANNKNNIWVGWPGIASDELSDNDREAIVHELAKQNCSPVFLTKKQIDDYYNGYSNTVLWPLFHQMRSQDYPGSQRDRWYRSYWTVNRLFAEAVESSLIGNAQVWVHDYQLLLVPDMLRKMSPDVTIGYFHHIPFPETKKYLSLQHAHRILKGMIGADLIGFHTIGYVENFFKTCEQAGLGSADDGKLLVGGRTVRVADFPMGIDYEKYASSGDSKTVRFAGKKYRSRYRRLKVIVAVDRLDPSKGLPERIKAYGQFLEQYPKFRKKVVFVMVAAPSRTDVPAYQRLAKRLSAMVKDINETYGTKSWQPIDYINDTIPFEEVTALFRVADVAFIAPLRDGMNLAAKEFVASARNDSVLILSETAGASQELRDALIVNPRKPETVVRALHDSLTMRRVELRGRILRMKQHLQRNTVQKWAKDFVGTLQKPVSRTSALTMTRKLSAKSELRLLDDFANSRRRLLLLDYDGSLVPFVNDHRKAKPPKTLLSLLKRLGKQQSTDIVLISGRSAKNLDEWFGSLPVHLVAEHGASLKRKDGTWQKYAKSDTSWKRQLLTLLQEYADEVPGAKVEEKSHSIVWHYRNISAYNAQKYLVIIRRDLRPFLKLYGLETLRGNKVLEIKDPKFTKGTAAQEWLNEEYDFILGIGDDTTDEDLFKALPEPAYSVKVGHGITAARLRVANHQDVVRLLNTLLIK